MDKQNPPSLVILRRKKVEEKMGLSRSTIYARMNPKSGCYDPSFPKPIVLGNSMDKSAVGWIEAELDAWLVTQIEKSRQAG